MEPEKLDCKQVYARFTSIGHFNHQSFSSCIQFESIEQKPETTPTTCTTFEVAAAAPAAAAAATLLQFFGRIWGRSSKPLCSCTTARNAPHRTQLLHSAHRHSQHRTPRRASHTQSPETKQTDRRLEGGGGERKKAKRREIKEEKKSTHFIYWSSTWRFTLWVDDIDVHRSSR